MRAYNQGRESVVTRSVFIRHRAVGMFVALALFSLVAVRPADSVVAPLTMTGEVLQLQAIVPPSPDFATNGCFPGTRPSFPPGSGVQEGFVNWSGAGAATGPYPGTFSVSGTARFNWHSNPTDPLFGAAIIFRLAESFRIVSGSALIEGTVTASSGVAGVGSTNCAGADLQTVSPQLGSTGRYRVIIRSEGRAWRDEGTTGLAITTSTPTNARIPFVQLFTETFLSQLVTPVFIGPSPG